jgi:hypothetical protein
MPSGLAVSPLRDLWQALWPALAALGEILLLARVRTLPLAAIPALAAFWAPLLFLSAVIIEVGIAGAALPLLLGISAWVEPLLVLAAVWVSLLLPGPPRTLADGAIAGAAVGVGPYAIWAALRVAELRAELHAAAWRALPSPAWDVWAPGLSVRAPGAVHPPVVSLR